MVLKSTVQCVTVYVVDKFYIQEAESVSFKDELKSSVRTEEEIIDEAWEKLYLQSMEHAEKIIKEVKGSMKVKAHNREFCFGNTIRVEKTLCTRQSSEWFPGLNDYEKNTYKKVIELGNKDGMLVYGKWEKKDDRKVYNISFSIDLKTK